jgi:ribosomal RNA-processing protein 36
VDTEWRRKEKAAVAAGKQNFHLKASEKKKLILAKKFEKLEAAGQLDKYMQKRRKRSSAKDHKKLPFRVREAAP